MRIVLDIANKCAMMDGMSEEEKKSVVQRNDKGHFLPGQGGNPAGYSIARRMEDKAITQALRNRYGEEDMLDRYDQAWDMAVQMKSVKAMMTWLEHVTVWWNGGKPPTRHIRMNTKFEDMLKALGSNEPVTVDGEVDEDSPAH